MSGLSSYSYYALAAAAVFVVVKTAYSASSTSSMPPSPPADLFLGHAKKIPRKETYKTYAKWGQLYGARFAQTLVILNADILESCIGDVVSASAPGHKIVILNSFAAARELLDKQSAVYSGRQKTTMFELCVHRRSSVHDHLLKSYLYAIYICYAE